MDRRFRIKPLSFLVAAACLFLYPLAEGFSFQATELAPLRLSLTGQTGSSSGGPECSQHGAPPAAGRPGAKPERVLQESEHRPAPVRTYHFSETRRLAQVKAMVRRPDGMVFEPALRLGVNPSLSFKTPFGDGPAHGAHNVYLVEEGVEEGTLLVRTAKWITMHHNCGWGHDRKFDETLTQPQPLESIPFEILINDLWDRNFHSRVASGQKLRITVLCKGKPAPGARVRITSEKGWGKEMVAGDDGRVEVQLVRDYYPSSWEDFNRNRRGEFLVTAQYELLQKGTFKDTPYDRIHYISSHPWYYTPAGSDYSSYSAGLLIMIGVISLSGLGIHLYRDRRKKPYQGIVFDE